MSRFAILDPVDDEPVLAALTAASVRGIRVSPVPHGMTCRFTGGMLPTAGGAP